jgi:hypothetical protein
MSAWKEKALRRNRASEEEEAKSLYCKERECFAKVAKTLPNYLRLPVVGFADEVMQ